MALAITERAIQQRRPFANLWEREIRKMKIIDIIKRIKKEILIYLKVFVKVKGYK